MPPLSTPVRLLTTLTPSSRTLTPRTSTLHRRRLIPNHHALSTSTRLSAGPTQSSGDYGSGAGDPKGEDPVAQGKNHATATHEHPGPKSPADKGGSADKGNGGESGGGSGPLDTGSGGKSGENSGKGAVAGGVGGEREGGKADEGRKSAKPKIIEHDISQESDRVESEDVKKHNQEMAQRHDRPTEVGADKEDKVDKGFWSGQGGADRQP